MTDNGNESEGSWTTVEAPVPVPTTPIIHSKPIPICAPPSLRITPAVSVKGPPVCETAPARPKRADLLTVQSLAKRKTKYGTPFLDLLPNTQDDTPLSKEVDGIFSVACEPSVVGTSSIIQGRPDNVPMRRPPGGPLPNQQRQPPPRARIVLINRNPPKRPLPDNFDLLNRYPPVVEGHFDPHDPIRSPPRGFPGKELSTEEVIFDDTEYFLRFQKALANLPSGDEELRIKIETRKVEVKLLKEKIHVYNPMGEEYLVNFHPDMWINDARRLEKFEAELYAWQMEMRERAAGLAKVLNPFVGRTFMREPPKEPGNTVCTQIMMDSRWTGLDHAEDSGCEEAPDSLVPDWFPVFDSYDIAPLSSRTAKGRYAEFVNLTCKLKEEFADPDLQGNGFDQRKKWKLIWHDPNPGWESPQARVHGG